MSLVAAQFNTGPIPNPSSSSQPSQKLTKKQKKGLAFRERKTGKPSHNDKTSTEEEDQYELAQMDIAAIPAMEDQDQASGPGDRLQVEGVLDKKKGKPGKAKGGQIDKGKGERQSKYGEEEVGVAVQSGKAKKRKREEVAGEEVDGGRKSRKVKVAKEGGEEEATTTTATTQESSKKQRFILFVGNFKYTTSKDAIQAHFGACEPPPDIRLLTPRPRPGVPARPKSKGCAFLEFGAKSGLQQALKLHQSMLDGRMINVELTAGGGGKSETRLKRVKERNKGLLTQRQKKLEITSNTPSDTIPSRPDRPQRYSTTSGLDEAPSAKRTWTVGNEVEASRRGGKRHARGKKGPMVSAAWGTGVNAIPVG